MNRGDQHQGMRAPRLVLPLYDGKEDWRPFYLQFRRNIRRFDWDEDESLDRLIDSLRGKALSYFSCQPLPVQADFQHTVDRMDRRFNRRLLPATARRLIPSLTQRTEESLEEFADRVHQTVMEGFLELDGGAPGNDTMQTLELLAVDTFLKGCADTAAAYGASEKGPSTLQDALQKIKMAEANLKVFAPRWASQGKVRQVHFAEGQGEEEGVVRSLGAGEGPRLKAVETGLAAIGSTVESHIKQVDSQLEEISTMLKGLQSSAGRRNSSPSPQRSGCFHCGKVGHFKQECPQLNRGDSAPNRSRSPSPSLRVPLNGNRLGVQTDA